MSQEQGFLIVGLGNPGPKYAKTRHNLGYRLVAELARQEGWLFRKEKTLEGFVAKGVKGGISYILLLPTTYMNESGRSVKAALYHWKLDAEKQLLVVSDDTTLPFGELRMRLEGSSGGHNGLKSIERELASRHYPRLRMGIGQKPIKWDLADYVLSPFSSEEELLIPSFLEKGLIVLLKEVSATRDK